MSNSKETSIQLTEEQQKNLEAMLSSREKFSKRGGEISSQYTKLINFHFFLIHLDDRGSKRNRRALVSARSYSEACSYLKNCAFSGEGMLYNYYCMDVSIYSWEESKYEAGIIEVREPGDLENPYYIIQTQEKVGESVACDLIKKTYIALIYWSKPDELAHYYCDRQYTLIVAANSITDAVAYVSNCVPKLVRGGYVCYEISVQILESTGSPLGVLSVYDNDEGKDISKKFMSM